MSTVIVGGGPAGLAAAIELRRLGAGHVVVLEREADAGGVPRHCDHTGFGFRDLHRIFRGPRYARRYVDLALGAGVEIRTSATATGWTAPTTLTVTSPRGLETLAADAVLLATGCRERPRSARLVPGTRPLGVFTTGSLQQLVHLHHVRVGRRAVVVGAEHVSFSAVMTLGRVGCETAAMVTEHPRHQTYGALAWLAAGRRHVPIATGSVVSTIAGRTRVEGVEVTNLDTGVRRSLACDTIVFTGDWIPDHELARQGAVEHDPATRGPRVDQDGHTQIPGVFAAGNLVHAAETADVAALGGRRVGRAIVAFLATGVWPLPRIPITCEAPLDWVVPGVMVPGRPIGGLVLRTTTRCGRADVVVTQGTRELVRRRMQLVPNRSIRIPVGVAETSEPLRVRAVATPAS